MNEADDTPEGIVVVIVRAASILLAGTTPALMRVSMNAEIDCVDATVWGVGEDVDGVAVKNEVTRAARFATLRLADVPV